MNDYNPPTPIKATIIQMPAERQTLLRITRHPQNPQGRTFTLTLTVPVTLEISLHPDQLRTLLEAA